MTTLSQTGFAVASALVSRGAPLVAVFVAARLLSPEQFGGFAVAMAVHNLLGALVSGGGDLWLNRFTWRPFATGRWAVAVRRRYLEICLAITGLVAVCTIVASFLPAFRDWQALTLAVGLSACVIGLGEVVFAIMRSGGQVVPFFVLRDLVAPILFVLLLLAVAPQSAATAVMLQPAATALPLAVAIVFVRAKGLMLDGRRTAQRICRGLRLQRLLRHTGVLLIGNLSSRLSGTVDIYVLGALVSAAMIGEYRVAGQLALGFLVVQHFVFLGLPWQMRRFGSSAEIAERRAEVRGRYLLLLGASSLALIVLLAVSEPLLALFGERFVAVQSIFALLLAVRYLNLLWGPQHQMLVSNGYILKDAFAFVVTLLVWLAIFALFSQVADLMYAAVIGHAAASLAGHYYRHRLLLALGIAPLVTAWPMILVIVVCYPIVGGLALYLAP